MSLVLFRLCLVALSVAETVFVYYVEANFHEILFSNSRHCVVAGVEEQWYK